MKRQALETDQKALEINLNNKIYGTFAEIGAGQEVARYFFQVGAAAGTIAKTMSAYDKTYSDKIYGVEASGRYVCESRLYKMLDHEYGLMVDRLQKERPESNFFAFADTVSAINYSRTIKGDGWLGIRFQLHPEGASNDLVIHARMLDSSNQLQQQAIGILGVNLVYACFHYYEDPEVMLQSLMDSLEGRIAIDMVRLSGPDFEHVDNRWLSLKCVQHGLTEVAMFGPDGKNVHGSEFLYKKQLLLVRGSFRPVTLVNEDMINKSLEQFRQMPRIDAKRAYMLTEITLDNLCKDGELDEKDFLDRADLLNELGQYVVISNCKSYKRLMDYFSNFKVQKVGVVIGVRELLEMVSQKYYENTEGRLLAVFGETFNRNVRFLVYPAFQEGSEEIMTAKNLPIPEGVQFLYRHLIDSQQIVDIENYNPEILHIFSNRVLEMIKSDEEGWEEMVPKSISAMIKSECLFGFPSERMTFSY